MAINVKLLKNYIKNDLNVIISGPTGTGKTAMLRQASEELGLSMKYYETPTLDPFTDLVGIPVPQHDSKSIEYYRPKDIDEADVVFFDEVNRADTRVLNTLFELLQFKTINGEPLPKLKVVVAAMNPDNGDYTVDKLDVALLDRFDIYLSAEPNIDFSYFRSKFGAEAARVVSAWWRSYHTQQVKASARSNNETSYISPRRMDKIVSAFQKIPEISTIRNSLPVNATANVHELFNGLRDAFSEKKTTTTSSSNSKFDDLFAMDAAKLRSRANVKLLENAITGNELSPQEKSQLLNNISLAFSVHLGAERIVNEWSFAVKAMTDSQRKQMMSSWSAQKRREFSTAYSVVN